jgi:Mitochondrial domain of unknown function (DUF1713)
MRGRGGRSGTLSLWRVPGRPMRALRTVRRHARQPGHSSEGGFVGSVIKKRRKRMAKKKHRKLLRKTRVQRRNKK